MRFVSDAALVLECEVFIGDGPSSIPCVHATTLHSSEALENVWHSKFIFKKFTCFSSAQSQRERISKGTAGTRTEKGGQKCNGTKKIGTC
jgi:hypothetical protein